MSRHIIKFAVISFGLVFGHSSLAANNGANWSGYYVGATAGYGWGSADNILNITDGTGVACHFCSASDTALAQSVGSTGIDPKGFVGGVQGGYNWQRARWVYGLEGDFQFFDVRQNADSSVTLPANLGNCGGGVACVGNFSNSVRADWLLTIRPRLGYAWDNMLLYGTAGLAISQLKFTQTYSDNIFLPFGSGGSESASVSRTRLGWTVGGGLEYGVGGNWSAKLEYLYVRFDGLNSTGVLNDFFTPLTGDFANFSNSIDHFSTNIVRVGINYKFGAP